MQYLLHKKGKTVIDTINGCSLEPPEIFLGYVGADFEKTFVIVNSFGSGNPYYIRLLDKEIAKDLLPEGSAGIGMDTLRQVLLYSKVDILSEKDKVTLFDAKKMTQKEYTFPKEIIEFNEPEKLNRIHLTEVTENNFTVEYEFDDWKKKSKRTYTR